MVIGSGSGAGAGEANDFQVVASGQAIEKPEGGWVRPAYLNPHDTAKSGQDTALGDLLKTPGGNPAPGGGNLMARCRPPSTGQLPESYAALMTGLRQWLSHSGESIFGTRSGPWPDQSAVPVTTRGDTWYLHFLTREMASRPGRCGGPARQDAPPAHRRFRSFHLLRWYANRHALGSQSFRLGGCRRSYGGDVIAETMTMAGRCETCRSEAHADRFLRYNALESIRRNTRSRSLRNVHQQTRHSQPAHRSWMER